MNSFIKILFTIIFLVSVVNASHSVPCISFEELLEQSELHPDKVTAARKIALSKHLPVNILTLNKTMYDAKGMEDGKVVYAVFTDLADVYKGGYCAFYEDVEFNVDLSTSRVDYVNGNITDNTVGLYNPQLSDYSVGEIYLMVTDWTYDRVYLFK